MKKLLTVAVAAVAAAVTYEFVKSRSAEPPQPEGADFEPAPRPEQIRVPASGSQASGDLTTVTGIGPVYAGRLNEMGIDDLGGLSAADTTVLAAGLGVSENSVRRWQDQARRLSS